MLWCFFFFFFFFFQRSEIKERQVGTKKKKKIIIIGFIIKGNTILVAISEGSPPDFVSMGTNAYLVINREAKKSDKPILGPTYNTGKGPVVKAGDVKSRRPEPTETEEGGEQTAMDTTETDEAEGVTETEKQQMEN